MADDWASDFEAAYGGVNLGGLDFNFNILGNVDWSPFETFMSDPLIFLLQEHDEKAKKIKKELE